MRTARALEVLMKVRWTALKDTTGRGKHDMGVIFVMSMSAIVNVERKRRAPFMKGGYRILHTRRMVVLNGTLHLQEDEHIRSPAHETHA